MEKMATLNIRSSEINTFSSHFRDNHSQNFSDNESENESLSSQEETGDRDSSDERLDEKMALDLRKKMILQDSDPEHKDDVSSQAEATASPVSISASVKSETNKSFQVSEEERQLLCSARDRLRKCLKIDSIPANERNLVIKRAMALLYLYLQKAGRKLFEESISSLSKFLRIIDSTIQVKLAEQNMAVSSTSDSPVIITRGPNGPARHSPHRYQPYGNFQSNLPLISPMNNTYQTVPHFQNEWPIHNITETDHSLYLRNRTGIIDNALDGQYCDMGDIEIDPATIERICKILQDMNYLPDLSDYNMDDILSNSSDSPSSSYVEVHSPLEENDHLHYSSLPDLIPADTESNPRSPPELLPINSQSCGFKSPNYAISSVLSQCSNSPFPQSPQYSQSCSIAASPLSSAASSPAPCSPSSRAVVTQLTNMNLHHSHTPQLLPCPLPEHLKWRTARDEIIARLDVLVKEASMRSVAKCPLSTLVAPDPDGDTPLMVACANVSYKYEDLYALCERLKAHPNEFTVRNNKRETALFLACLEKRALVAGYLAELIVAVNKKSFLNEAYHKGNTIVHYLAIWGDDFSEVMEYLVRIRTPDFQLAFDLSLRNHEGRSPLHEAVIRHGTVDSTGQISCVKNINLLLKYGADAGCHDGTSGKTPVHLAVEKRDPDLLSLLLSKCPAAANALMYNNNAPLHSAATLADVTEEQQLELVNILLRYGAEKSLRNKAKKLPIELVQQDRQRVKRVLMARPKQGHVN